MFVRPISTLSAAPLLHLRLARIARAPLARLACTFHAVPRRPCPQAGPIATEDFCCWRVAQRLPNKCTELLAEQWAVGQLQLRRSLGQAIYLDTLLAGTQIGERLPLANCAIENDQRQVGCLLDLQA